MFFVIQDDADDAEKYKKRGIIHSTFSHQVYCLPKGHEQHTVQTA